MANITILNKLPNTRVLVAAENGSVEVLELVALFLLEKETFGAKRFLVGDFRRCYISCFFEIFFFGKGKGKYTITLINRCSFILP